MPCDHTGPAELIEMAERYLRERNLAPDQWNGARFAWRENVAEPKYWTSVILEVERRGNDWVVTRLDRSNDSIDEQELGFHAMQVP
jgi:hypothetical protein